MNQLAQQGLVVIEGRATYERIVTYIREVEPEEAIRQIHNFLKIYPEFAQAHNDLAVLHYQTGNGMRALAHYEKAHKLEPKNITFRKNLADFYFVELEWADDAIQTYLDILKDNPFDIETLNALGTISVQTGRREQARQYFTRTLQLDTLNGLARQALQQLGGQLPAAELYVQIANEVQQAFAPTPPPAVTPFQPHEVHSPEELHRQALELAHIGQNLDARRLLETLVILFPHYAAAHNDIAILFQQEGDLSQARRHQEEALHLQPDNLNFQKNLADLLYIACGETEEALKLYVNILASHPRDIDTLNAISSICIAAGKLDDSRSFLESILDIEPNNIGALESLAAISDLSINDHSLSPQHHCADNLYAAALQFVQQNQLIEAHALLEELVHINSSNALYHNDLGVLRYQLGDVKGAQRAYERAVELQPINTNFLKNLADLYFIELGKFDEAIAIYLDLLQLFPRDLEILAGLGHICTAVGQPDEAKSFYRRALEIEPWNSEIRAIMQSLF